jgi:hypothetical protein
MAHGGGLPFLGDIGEKAKEFRMVREAAAQQQSAANIVPWLNNQILGAQTVIFVGEEHTNGEDAAVAHAILGNLPLGANPFVVYERGLFNKYRVPKHQGADADYSEEPIGMENNMDRRNFMISQHAVDALGDGHDVIYIFCGDRHHGGVRGLVLGQIPAVVWIHKPSSV